MSGTIDSLMNTLSKLFVGDEKKKTSAVDPKITLASAKTDKAQPDEYALVRMGFELEGKATSIITRI